MAENKELKPKSFRIDEQTAEKFKNISATIGGNQQETLAKLIEAFEFQTGKAALTDKKTDIEQFERCVTIITRMYMSALEDNQNVTETVRAEFDALLKSKDVTIQDLQENLAVAKQTKEEATLKARTYADENTRLNDFIRKLNAEYNSKMDDMQSMLADKDSLNKALTDSCNDLKHKIGNMTHDVEQMTEVKKALDNLQKEYDKIITKADTLQTDLDSEKAKHEQSIAHMREQSQIVLDRALIDLERKYQDQIQQLKNDKQSEIDKYQQKYLDLLEQIKSNNATTQN